LRQWHTRRPEFLSAAEPGATLVLPGFTVRPCVDVEALEFALPFDDDPLPETLPLSIAFVYLCLILGKTAYAAELEPVRRALRDLDASPSPHWGRAAAVVAAVVDPPNTVWRSRRRRR
jgi:hypothetical protein